jgi:hypothetical protein
VKSLTTTILLSLTVGAFVAGVALLAQLSDVQGSWLLGSIVASVIGVVTMALKSTLANAKLEGAASLKALLAAQGAAFGIRLLAVGVGAFAVKGYDGSPPAFVISFLIVSLAQQVIEARSLLAAPKVSTP